MKHFIISAITLASFNASAISFITEEQVQQALGADKVIEISKYTVQDKLVAQNSECQQATYSRSARAYVVKKDHQALLYVTISDLRDLQLCGEL